MSTRRLQVPRQYNSSIFLNFPYDDQFRDLFLAYVVGVCSFGLTPRTTLEIAGGEQRLRRIAVLIRSCRFSFHDLSRVELDAREPATPRFNMPFETGLAVMYSLFDKAHSHTYFIFEADYRRLQKSLSDLGGTDVYAHGGTAEGVLREISNALISAKRRPTVERMLGFLEQVNGGLPDIMRNAGAKTPYSARVFSDLVVFTNELVKQQLADST
ncbi:MAG: hypothetical protein M3Y57_14670 [Acidobacteriota bacterium]|nr:hypothetical protein [Acidobacteriota bacterium]